MTQTISGLGIDIAKLVFHIVGMDDSGHVVLRKRIARSELLHFIATLPFRLRQQTRQVRQQGQIRLHNFGLYVDHGLSGQTVEVLMYDEAMRIEQAEHLLVWNTQMKRPPNYINILLMYSTKSQEAV